MAVRQIRWFPYVAPSVVERLQATLSMPLNDRGISDQAIPITSHPASIVRSSFTFQILIFFSSNLQPTWMKLGCDTSCMVLFQICVLCPCTTSRMAVMAFDWLKNFKSLKNFPQNHPIELNQIQSKYSLGGPFSKLCLLTPSNYPIWPPQLIM